MTQRTSSAKLLSVPVIAAIILAGAAGAGIVAVWPADVAELIKAKPALQKSAELASPTEPQDDELRPLRGPVQVHNPARQRPVPAVAAAKSPPVIPAKQSANPAGTKTPNGTIASIDDVLSRDRTVVPASLSNTTIATPQPPMLLKPPAPARLETSEPKPTVLASLNSNPSQPPPPPPAAEVKAPEKPLKPEAVADAYFPDTEDDLPAKRIFRLTREQIDASVKTLLPVYFKQSIKEVMSRDPLQTNYEYAELLSFNSANLGQLSGWISAIATRVRADAAGVIDCKAGDAECLKTQARKFVLKAFRGDVSEKKLAETAEFYLKSVSSSDVNQATGDLVEVVLNSPNFLFRKELDAVAKTDTMLVPVQHLQALSYTLADSPPEAFNLDSQNAKQILADPRTIERIVNSKPSRDKLVRFFKAWLEINEPGEFTISPEVYKSFTPKFAAAMLEETDKFLATQLSKPAPKLKDITQPQEPFVSKVLASINSADPADAKPVRLGIFSQPAVLASHSGPTNSRPVKRGVFWARKVMCREMGPPPPDAHNKVYEMTGATERKRIESVTQAPSCMGCHKVINPLGFFQEGYDALGNWRTKDENKQPIDTSVLIDFLDEGETKADTPVEALQTLTSSMKFKQCFVRQLFRYYMGRGEEASDDPLLKDMFVKFATNDNQDILGMVTLLSSSPRFGRRADQIAKQ